MPEIQMAAEIREEFGKGPARQVRRAGRVPAVLYGHGTEPRHLSLPAHDLMLALKTSNALLRLEGLKSGGELALPKAVQRDPVRDIIEHVDLILVRRGEKVTVEIAILVTGEIQSGGVLDQQLIQVTVEAEATNIPQSVEVNVEGFEVGQAVHASDLKLPQGVTMQLEPETLILHVIQPAAEEAAAAAEVTEVPAPVDGVAPAAAPAE